MLPVKSIYVALVVIVIAAGATFGQTAPPATTGATKATTLKAKKATRAVPPVIFDAHNEGSVEGAIYGEENLVSVTIDSSGIHYQTKSAGNNDEPVVIPWDQLSGWQANNFTSRRPRLTADGDYGIGLYLGAHYVSLRTRNGPDFTAAIKALRSLAVLKERPGIG